MIEREQTYHIKLYFIILWNVDDNLIGSKACQHEFLLGWYFQNKGNLVTPKADIKICRTLMHTMQFLVFLFSLLPLKKEEAR